MRTTAIHSPLHKPQVLYLMPLIPSPQVCSFTCLLVLVPKSSFPRFAEKALENGKGFYFPEDVKIYEQNLIIKEC